MIVVDNCLVGNCILCALWHILRIVWNDEFLNKRCLKHFKLFLFLKRKEWGVSPKLLVKVFEKRFLVSIKVFRKEFPLSDIRQNFPRY